MEPAERETASRGEYNGPLRRDPQQPVRVTPHDLLKISGEVDRCSRLNVSRATHRTRIVPPQDRQDSGPFCRAVFKDIPSRIFLHASEMKRSIASRPTTRQSCGTGGNVKGISRVQRHDPAIAERGGCCARDDQAEVLDDSAGRVHLRPHFSDHFQPGSYVARPMVSGPMRTTSKRSCEKLRTSSGRTA